MKTYEKAVTKKKVETEEEKPVSHRLNRLLEISVKKNTKELYTQQKGKKKKRNPIV